MSIFSRVGKITKSLGTVFGLRDIFVFGGLAMMGYGLYLWEPWVAFTVCGFLLFIIGAPLGPRRG